MSTDMEAPPIERKLVAILAADIQGYSGLMGIDKENTLATLSAHRAITDALIQQHFAQAKLALGEERRMWFRIGINIGDVMVKDHDIADIDADAKPHTALF